MEIFTGQSLCSKMLNEIILMKFLPSTALDGIKWVLILLMVSSGDVQMLPIDFLTLVGFQYQIVIYPEILNIRESKNPFLAFRAKFLTTNNLTER